MTDSNAISQDRAADPAQAAEVFYDGGCPLCRAEIAQYRQMRGAGTIAFRDVSAGDAPPEIDPAAALARFHVRRADGALTSGFRAFLAVWRANPRLAPVARLLDHAPFTWAGEAAYLLFLKVRPLWRRAR